MIVQRTASYAVWRCGFGFSSFQAILAGCALPTSLLKCFLLDPLDKVAARFQSTRLYNVLDDVARAVAETVRTICDVPAM